MKKLLAVLLLVLSFSLIACKKAEKDFTVCLASTPDTIDPALNSSVDGATYIIHAFSGLVGYNQDKNGSLELVPACAKAIPTAEKTEDGKVKYVFELKDGLKWSDGTALDANDFVYAWNRAVAPATAADYNYMFDVIDGFVEASSPTSEEDLTPKGKLNVTASADGKKLTVVLPIDVPYFMELCAFPTYMPVKKEIVEADPESWATKPETYVSNGAYKLEKFINNDKLVFVKNENYYDADAVTLDKIVFALSSDDGQILASYKNGTYTFIDTVPTDEIDNLKSDKYKDEFFITGQLGTYYVIFNVNDETFKDYTEEQRVKIRTALSLLLDRNYVVTEIGKAGQVPANGFVAMGLLEPDGTTQFIEKNGFNGDGKGYFSVAAEDYSSNCDEAINLLKEVGFNFDTATKKFTDFPKIAYLTNDGTGHVAIATYIQQVFAGYGITMSMNTQEWNTFLNTRKNGEYSIARNGWLGDYNDPISFLDMWTTQSGNNDAQFGRDAHATYAGYSFKGQTGLTWAQSYDVCIASVKASGDPATRFELMHEAENILMSTGAICPIYYYTDLYMCKTNVKGFFSSPLGYKYFMFCEVTK